MAEILFALVSSAPLMIVALFLRAAHKGRAVRRRAESLIARGEEVAPPGPLKSLKARADRLPGIGRRLAALGVVAVGPILVGGTAGWLWGLAAVYGMWRWRRQRAAGGGAHDAEGAVPPVSADEVERQLPLAADLMAACLAAGAGPREAAEAVGASLGGPVGKGLAQAAAEVRLGGDPAAAWSRLGDLPRARSLARCLERAQATGVPAVEPMSRLAGRWRAERNRTAGIRARRAGVLVTAPLGLCFLPAFLTVGVVPVVIGLASGLMKGN
ncbi:type II secretion system F family protein [Streptomyces sp. UNOC14_S4]|uniref:type II secretion system F family protein n=1 Tax=Streptomyces sp. UNOC14_S4 TaxID=2872340 RepID=UPI001E4B8840|nr:type II secretion system F family protein [Streptomyces sp. UNOC14_S4]